MESIIIIFAVFVLGCGLLLLAPVTFFCGFALDTPPLITVSVHFLFIRHQVAKKRREKADIRRKENSSDKGKQIRRKGAADKLSLHGLLFFLRRHQIIRDVLATLLYCAKKFIVSADRYYVKVNLHGGFRSPDLTGQVYGFVQACRSISSDSLSLTYHPDFMADRLGGAIGAGAVIKVYNLIQLLIVFFWRLPKLKLIQTYLYYRKEGIRV